MAIFYIKNLYKGVKKMNYLNVRTNEEKAFTINKEVLLSDKVSLVKYVSEMVVSDELGYMLILKDTFFNYAILQYYTDIVVFENEEDFSIDELDKFLKINSGIMNTIRVEIGTEEVNFLKNCCNELIKFRRMHFGEYKNDIAELLAMVRELVVKPDYMNELLKAVTEWVNTAATKEIDFDVLSKFADVIPTLNGMNNVDVAKAILKDVKAEVVSE